jgi:hypothetical protein
MTRWLVIYRTNGRRYKRFVHADFIGQARSTYHDLFDPEYTTEVIDIHASDPAN